LPSSALELELLELELSLLPELLELELSLLPELLELLPQPANRARHMAALSKSARIFFPFFIFRFPPQ
jgi:hypothetical protein